jgi:hypothetical protein
LIYANQSIFLLIAGAAAAAVNVKCGLWYVLQIMSKGVPFELYWTRRSFFQEERSMDMWYSQEPVEASSICHVCFCMIFQGAQKDALSVNPYKYIP